MTREEAIKELESYAVESWGDLNEAFNMAIAALRDQEGKDTNVPTNADRIRSMTDEELVNLHYSCSAHCIADDPTVCDRHDFIGNLTPCEQCYLKWLQQPAGEEDKHESN